MSVRGECADIDVLHVGGNGECGAFGRRGVAEQAPAVFILNLCLIEQVAGVSEMGGAGRHCVACYVGASEKFVLADEAECSRERY